MNAIALRQEMVARLVSAGRLRSQPWREAFAQIPRHQFLPRFFRQSSDLSGWEAVSRTDDAALALIYSDTTWVTQLDNDPDRWAAVRRSGQPGPGTPTSSSTAPGLMALMLETLQVGDQDRILEIGTGTGYNAALLSHRLGSELVTTVEVDPAVAVAARSALHSSGCTPTVVVGDGTAGHLAGGRFDRLIATCATPNVPAPWLAQVRPGGRLLVSLHRDLGGGALVRLQVDRDGGASGWFLAEYGSFMPVRTHRFVDPSARLAAALGTEATTGDARPITIDPQDIDRIDFGMVAALRLPGVASIGFEPATGPQRWLLSDDGAWAWVEEATGLVTQSGSRRLWDELESAHRDWAGWGEPARERFGLTVTRTGQHQFWLDTPQRVRWTTPAP